MVNNSITPVTSMSASRRGSAIESDIRRAGEQNAAYLNEAKALYEPYANAGASSLDQYVKLLLGGVDNLSNDQNFQSMQNLAEKKVMANRAVSGLLRSSGTAAALDDTLLRFANDYYGNRLNQLAQGVGIGQNAVNSQASILEKLGGNATDLASALANIQMQREGNQATIDAASAQAGATTAAAKSKAKSDLAGGAISAVGKIIASAFI